MPTPAPSSPPPAPSHSRGWRIVRTVGRFGFRFFLFLFFLIALSLFLLRLPVVQNYAADRATAYLSEELGTRVELDYINFEFFDNIVLRDLLLEDRAGDTLLAARELSVNANLFTALRGQLEIEEVNLRGARVSIRRDSGQVNPNYQFVVDYFIRPDSLRKEPKPFYFNARYLNLDDVAFRNADAVKGSQQDFYVRRGSALVERLDLANNVLLVERFTVDGLRVHLQLFPAYPTVIDSTFVGPSVQLVLNDSLAKPPLQLQLADLEVSDGRFRLNNWRKEPVRARPADVLDYNHLDVRDINLQFTNVRVDDTDLNGRVRQLALRAASGFVLENLAAKSVRVTDRQVGLYDMELVTPRTRLADTLVFKFREWSDWQNFNDGVRMDIRLDADSRVLLDDIITFAPNLANNPFFAGNRNELVRLNGRVSGQVNNLRGRDLDIRLGNTVLKGRFASRNLTVYDDASLNLKLDELRTTTRNLRAIIPGMAKLPPAFDRFGTIRFDGSFDGFLVDFVAYGKLQTDIGAAELDMRMNTKNGLRDARYSGNLRLQEFDLAALTGNAQFGKVTLTTSVANGRGLDAATADADLEAVIRSFEFRDYRYENLTLRGELNQRLFDGRFAIADENVDFEFDGLVDFTAARPRFDFTADVRRIDLAALNLARRALTVAGRIDLDVTDVDPTDMTGYAHFFDLRLEDGTRDTIRIDSVLLAAERTADSRRITGAGDLLRFEVAGDYDVERIAPDVVHYIRNNYPEYAERLRLRAPRLAMTDSRFIYDFTLVNTRGLAALLDPKLAELDNVELTGEFDAPAQRLLVDFHVPVVGYDKVRLSDVLLILDAEGDEAQLDVGVMNTTVDQKLEFAPFSVLASIQRDTAEVGISSINLNPSILLDNLALNAIIYPAGTDEYVVRFEDSDIVIWNEKWSILKDNALRIGKRSVRTENFVLTNADRAIRLRSEGERGLAVELDNIEAEFINRLWIYPPLYFTGGIDIAARAENIFKLEGLTAAVDMDTLFINQDSWGPLRLRARTDNLKQSVTGDLRIGNAIGKRLAADITFNPPGIESKQAGFRGAGNYLNVAVEARDLPVNMAEYWIGHSVSDTEGTFNGDFRIFGVLPTLDIEGTGKAYDIATTIDYLGTRYFVDEGEITTSPGRFNIDGTILRDELGNTAVVTGGMVHDNLKRLGVDLALNSERFLVLNTTKEQNPVYYGTGLGRGYITFKGQLNKVDIYVNATTGSGTEVFIPVSTSSTVGEVSFIRFKDPIGLGGMPPTQTASDIIGLSIDLDLTFTEEATTYIIFDELAGDIIRGKGTGNLQIKVPRTSKEFLMFGEYVIEEGDYLFTLASVVNKPFRVERGGTIRWTGDPFEAQLDLVAQYDDLQAGISNFIQEYLVSVPNQQVRTEARRPTDVDLNMLMTGSLLKPNIEFELAFPELQGQLRNFAQNKLQIIRQDPNELNRQVFGLIVAGQFLPSNAGFQSQELTNIGFNTVTEFFSQQLSLYFTQLLSDWLVSDGLISGVDFDVNYSVYQAEAADAVGNVGNGAEFLIRPKIYLYDDRLSVSVSGASTQVTGTSGALFAGDVVIEYYLTADRQLRIRFYQNTQPEFGGGRRNRTGLGLSYRKEFNTFEELLGGMKKDSRRAFLPNK